MWPSLICDTDWCYHSTGLYTVFEPVYIIHNINAQKIFKESYNCLFARFYLFLKLQFLLGFLIPWTISCIYIVCQILVFNAIHTIVTDMEGNIRIDRLPLGHGTDCETDISLASGDIISTGLYHDPWKTLYPDISLHISNIYINIDNIRSYWIYWHNFEKKHLCQN